MITERQRTERRVALRALVASAMAVALTVTATSGIVSEPNPDGVAPAINLLTRR